LQFCKGVAALALLLIEQRGHACLHGVVRVPAPLAGGTGGVASCPFEQGPPSYLCLSKLV